MKRDKKGKKVIVEQWAGRWTFRARLWRLWPGANLNTCRAFIIWNGPSHNWQIQTHNWQIQSLAHWRTGQRKMRRGILTEQGAHRINRPDLCDVVVFYDRLRRPFFTCANNVFYNGNRISGYLSIFGDEPGLIPVISIRQRMAGMIIMVLVTVTIFLVQG